MREYADARDRFALWEQVLSDRAPQSVAEVGVFQGAFAARALAATESIATYYMIDPWRHLDDWNKPFNRSDDSLERVFEAAMAATDFAGDRRVVLRGTTAEVSDQIPDQSLDFVYIDGDHTLRGITIDLMKMWPKMRPGGLICGDDLSRTIWQHSDEFEPTLVFPYTTYFAEAVGAPMWALPHNQFAIEVREGGGFDDVAGIYRDRSVSGAMTRPNRSWLRRTMGRAKRSLLR